MQVQMETKLQVNSKMQVQVQVQVQVQDQLYWVQAEVVHLLPVLGQCGQYGVQLCQVGEAVGEGRGGGEERGRSMGSKKSGTVCVWLRAMRARVEDRMTSATTRMEGYTCRGKGQG